MRETRMTFGEHLEELRARVIMALFWLALATGGCLVFGKHFMHLSLQPHEKAVLRAMNHRHHLQLVELVGELKKVEGQGDPGPWDGPWDLLFTTVVHRQSTDAITAELGAPFRAEADRLDQNQEIPKAVRDAISDAWGRIGQELPARLKGYLTSPSYTVDKVDYVEKFKTLEEKLDGIKEILEPTPFQKLLGLGRSFSEVHEPVKDFQGFLTQRREQIKLSYENAGSFAAVQDLLREDWEEKQAARAWIDDIHHKLDSHIETVRDQRSDPPVILEYLEGFSSYFLVSIIFGIFFSLPLILYEMWKFIGSGLYEKEQKYVLIFMPFSIGLFIAGAVFGFFWMVPIGLEFLASWGAEFAELNFSLGRYIRLFFTLTILLGLVFQTPLVMIFLNQIGMVTAKQFAAARKYTLLGAVIFSTLVTPPDPVSWSMMAGPIMVLYEFGLRICHVLERRKKKGTDEETGSGSQRSVGDQEPTKLKR